MPDTITMTAEQFAERIKQFDELEPGLDVGITHYVRTLYEAGVETFESCQGGDGHSYPEPTVRFHGERAEGLRALSVALQHGLPVMDLCRVWRVIDGEPTGPYWQLTFSGREVPVLVRAHQDEQTAERLRRARDFFPEPPPNVHILPDGMIRVDPPSRA